MLAERTGAAAALWELDGIEPGVVELTTTGSRSDTLPGVILHRTRMLPRSSFGTSEPSG